ncbi:hypothetical protein B7P43_G13145 [Cryptotermes secundus]|nr:hypothetical protein B7P43_G13145 [Cryptotermes secundus]
MIPLHVLWYFHHTDLVMFTSYIYCNENRTEVIDHIKCSMVNLLCSLSGVASSDARDVSSGINEQMMDVEEIITASANQTNSVNDIILDEIRDNDEGDLLQLKQEMASELVSLLLSVAQVPGPNNTVGIKSCAKNCDDILENIINRTMNSILAASLNAITEVKEPFSHKNYLSLLPDVSTLCAELLQPFLTSHLIITLTYKPHVDIYTAISKQDNWTYKKSPAILTSMTESMIVGLQAETLDVLKNVLQKGEVNWRLSLMCISTYVKFVPEGGRHMKGLIDWLLNKAFLNHNFSLLAAAFLIARQCCAEECAPWFTSYMSWFGTTFGSGSSWATHTSATQQTFEFFISFLTDIVPHEPPTCLRVHINKAPASPQSSLFLLRDYVTLAKTRLKDLNEAPGFGLLGPGFTTEQDIEHALKHFETHNGEVAQIVLSGSLFRRQHFEQEFLLKLLTPRVIPDTPDVKEKFIKRLHSMGKISHSLFSRYQDACLVEARIFQDALLSNSPETIPNLVDAREKFQESLQNLQESIKALYYQRESEKTCDKEETSHLSPSINNEFVNLSHCLHEMVGGTEKRESLGKHEPVPSADFVSGILDCNTEEWSQIVDQLMDVFVQCYSSVSGTLNLIWPNQYVRLFQPFRVLKIVLFHKLVKWCIDEVLPVSKLKAAAALLHSIEFLGSTVFPDVRHGDQDITFASYIAECLPLQNASQMSKCFRFAVEYMSYAESHLLNLKTSPEIHTCPSLKSSSNCMTENPFRKSPLLAEELTTVPVALARKYLYLYERYAFADRDQMMGTEMYQPDATNPWLWAPILAQAKMSCCVWFKQEANVNTYEDFLVSRHEYLLNRLTNSATFDSSNISQLASEILLTLHAMDCTQDTNRNTADCKSYQSWQSFHRDMTQALSTLIETYPLVGDAGSQPWLLNEWLTLDGKTHTAVCDKNFMRIVTVLQPWLLYSNSHFSSPDLHTVKCVANLVNTRLKDTLSDCNGFLNLSLVRYLLTGLSTTVVSGSKNMAHHIFSAIFDSCPALSLAARVHASTVLCIVQRFAASDMPSGTFSHILATLAMIKSKSLQEMALGTQAAKYWEVGLDVWLHQKHSPSLKTPVRRWVFFYTVLELGCQLQSGIISFKFDSGSISFQYNTKDVVQNNIITLLINELENDLSVIDTLDVIVQAEQLPFCGLSALSQNMMCVAAVLFLMLYNDLKETDSNKFLASGFDASLLCKVLLSCCTAWIKAGLPHSRIKKTLSESERNQKKMVTSPLVDKELLLGMKRGLSSILRTVSSRQTVRVPEIYITSIKHSELGNILGNILTQMGWSVR